VTRDSALPFIENGAVALDGKSIKDVGTTADLTAKYGKAAERVIDARGRLVMPGFINCHQHYYSTFARGMDSKSKPSTTFLEILKGLWWKMDKLLTSEDVYWSCIGPMIDEARCGVTTVFDHHAGPFAIPGSLAKIAEAAKLFGIRHNLSYEISDRDGAEKAAQGIQENADFAKLTAQNDDDMLRSMFGVHAQMTISEPTMEKMLAAEAETGVGFHVHVAEGFEDVADAIDKYDMRVAERLVKRHVLKPASIAVHCVCVTDAEIDMLAASGTAAVHNPESNMGNAVGVSPIIKMLEKGITVGMGTDGYVHDMTESYKVTGILQRINARNPSIGWAEPPLMLFENNREIANRHLKGKTGMLKAGYYADVIIVGYDGPTPINADTINSHILFGVTGRHVDTTICNGKIIMDERVLPGIDEEALMAKSREHAVALWGRI
jgi:putative selenium metabolism protein SsnA